jgi:hypothetical protein
LDMNIHSANLMRSARNLALGAMLATGFAGGAQAASLEIIAGPGGHHSGGGYTEGHHGGYHGGYRDGHRGGDRICRPGEAVQKAYRQGMRRPGIERVSRHEVVVSGRFRGHRAVLVFDRNSSRCRVLYSRGI